MISSSLNKIIVVLVSLAALTTLVSAQTTYNAFNDFYVNVPAPGGFPQSAWTENVGVYPGVTGLTNPNTWGYAGGNFNGGDGNPTSVGTYLPASGGLVYPLTSGGTYAGPGVSYLTGGVSFWIGYNDQYGIVGLPNAQTQIGKYTSEWFSGAPDYASNPEGANSKFLWIQATGLSPDTDGLGAMLTWTAPVAGTYTFSGSYVNGDYGQSTAFAIVDSLGNTLLSRQLLAAASVESSFNFTQSYSSGDVVQFQVGTPAASQGSPLGLAVNVVRAPATNAILTLQTSTNLANQWSNMPVTAGMITPTGELNVGPVSNTNTFYRLKIRTTVE
jgi:hypothetical protein